LNELTVLAGVALAYTLVVVWAAAPVRSCTMVAEPARYLNLEREVDREHLARHARQIQRAARQQIPDPSPDAVDRCQETLARELAASHEVTLDQVHTALDHER
jgi:hypothetical protein